MSNHTRKGHGTHSVAKMHTALPHELAQCMNEYENPISDTSGRRKTLLEDKRSGYITTKQLQEELALLRD